MIVVAAMGLLGGQMSAAETPSFTVPYLTFPSWGPTGPVSIADFNGDRRPDLVTSGTSNDCVPGCGSDYETIISAGLSSSSGFPAGARPIWSGDGGVLFATADFNLDGRDDLVLVTTYASHIAVLLTHSTLTGFDLGSLHPGGGVEDVRVITGDFNGDGKPDFALPTRNAPSGLSVFLGNGNGTFSRRELSAPSVHLVAAGDLDGNSRLDLVFYLPGKVAALLGTGDGSFVPGPVTDNGALGSWCQLADFTGDRIPDLLVDGGVLPGQGDGAFAPKIDHGVPGPSTAGDFDEDGRLDVAVAGLRMNVMLGTGDGHFSPPAVYEYGGGSAVIARDLDGDGHVDLAAPSGGWINILPGRGDGTFGDAGVVGVPDQPIALGVADLNHDGHSDLAVASGRAKTVTILSGSASGGLAPSAEVVTNHTPRSIVFDDLTMDGTPDLAVLNPPLLSVHVGRRDGTFGAPVSYPIDIQARKLSVGDLDEDGRPDLVVNGFYLRSIVLFFGHADGFRARIDPIPVEYSRLLVVGDFTGDGHLDIAVTSYRGLALLRGRGDGRFETTGPDDSPFSCIQDQEFRMLTAYDRYGDCRPMIAAGWRCCWYDRPSVFCSYHTAFLDFDSRGVLEWSGLSAPGVEATAMANGDLSGDGVGDLAAAFAPHGVSVSITGDPGTSPLLLATGAAPSTIALEDVNADGRLDIVTANAGSNTITVLKNLGSRPTIPRNPRGVVARPGDASITVSWDPVRHPELAAYRVYYGRADAEPTLSGTDAAEGRSPVSVPAPQTELTLSCLPESLYAVKVTALDRDGRESPCAASVSARPHPACARLSVTPRSLNDASHGTWVTARIDLRPAFTADDVIPGTIRLNGIAAGDEISPAGPKGRDFLMLRFPRDEVVQTLTGGSGVLTAEGLLRGCAEIVRFAAHDTVQTAFARRVGPGDGGAVAADPKSLSDRGGDHAGTLDFRLYSLTTNLVSSSVDIGFDLPKSASTRIRVFDVSGRLVGTLLQRMAPAGRQVARWDAARQAGGLYFIRLEAGDLRATLRVALAR